MSSDGTLDSFGDLRSLLQRPQVEETWDLICGWLESNRGALDSQPEQIAYLVAHLDRWPPQVLVAPKRWLERAQRGDDAGQMQLARVFDLSQASMRAEQVEMLGVLDEARVWGLNLSKNWLDDEAMARFAKLGPWEQLQELDLSFNRLQKAGVDHLWGAAQQGKLPALRVLNLERTVLEEGSLVKLGASGLPDSLEAISLGQNWLRPKDLADLRMHADFKRLKSLSLDRNRFGTFGVVNLLTMPERRFEHLEELGLSHNELDEHACSALAWSAETPSLERLNLSMNPIGDQGVRYLAESNLHPALKSLSCGHNGLTDDTMWAFSESPYFHNLEELDLMSNNITMQGVLYLVDREEELTSLRRLNLSSQPHFGADAMVRLWQWPRFKQLEFLDLSDCGICGGGSIPRTQDPLHLKELDLSYNDLGMEGLRDMLRWAPLPNIEVLHLDQCELSGALFEVLGQEAPELCQSLRVIHLNHNNIQDTEELLDRLDAFPLLEEVSLDHDYILGDLINRMLRERKESNS